MQLDFIKDPRFAVGPMTEAIISFPNEFGLLNQIGLFSDKGISETTVKVDIKNKQLHIIPTSPRGTPAHKSSSDTRGMKAFPTFRHALGDQLLADEFQNVRKFGENDELDVFEERLMEKLGDLAAAHRQTKEYLRWGALKGDVYDADGVTVLYNVYDEMDETQKEVEFELEETSGDPIQVGTDELLDHMELQAAGEPITGVLKICSPGYFTHLMLNEDFRKAYTYFSGQPNPLRDNLRNGFYHKGVNYLRHLGQATFKAEDGTTTTHKFIPDDEAIAVPLGTRQVFRTFNAPADYIETVNTIGKEMYAKTDIIKMDRGIEIETQSQSLNLVLKPRLVVRCTIG
ncbi:major capsid protein [Leptospira interrogans]